MEHPFNHGHSTPNRSITETYEQGEITRTAEDLFDRFDLEHNKVLNRDELLAFMRYAHKRCGNEKKSDFQLLCDL